MEVGVTVLDWGWVQQTCPVLQYLVSSIGKIMNVNHALAANLLTLNQPWIFSAPNIEGPPNIMVTPYLQYLGYTFIIMGTPDQYFS